MGSDQRHSCRPRIPSAADNRLFIEAVFFRFRADIPWRDLPERFFDIGTLIWRD
jgi:transposase